MERTILASQPVLNTPARDFRSEIRNVLHQFRPGERINHAEAFAEAMFGLGNQSIKLVAAGRIIVPGDGAQDIDRIQQLIEGNLLVRGERSRHVGQALKRIWYLNIPRQQVSRPATRVKNGTAELLPQAETWQILVLVNRNAVGLLVRVTCLQKPAPPLVLQVHAVLQRIGTARVRISPVDALAQVRQWAKRGSRWSRNSTTERIVQRVERSEIVVLRCRQESRAAESILPCGDERSLSKSAEAGADGGLRCKHVSHARAWLKLAEDQVVVPSRRAMQAVKELRAHDLERSGGNDLRECLHGGVRGVTRHDLCPSRLGGRCDGIHHERIENRSRAVITFRDRRLEVPAQAEVDGQLRSGAPVVLNIKRSEVLRPECIGVAREVAVAVVVRQPEHKCSQRQAVAGPAANGALLPRPLAPEVEAALVPDILVGLLKNPVFGAVLENHVAG